MAIDLNQVFYWSTTAGVFSALTEWTIAAGPAWEYRGCVVRSDGYYAHVFQLRTTKRHMIWGDWLRPIAKILDVISSI